MPHTLRASLGSFQLSFIKALVQVVHSLTMQFGSPLHSSRRLFTTLTLTHDYQIILLAQSYLHISSKKWQFTESVWSKIVYQVYNVRIELVHSMLYKKSLFCS